MQASSCGAGTVGWLPIFRQSAVGTTEAMFRKGPASVGPTGLGRQCSAVPQACAGATFFRPLCGLALWQLQHLLRGRQASESNIKGTLGREHARGMLLHPAEQFAILKQFEIALLQARSSVG